jgi:hypothetical protein
MRNNITRELLDGLKPQALRGRPRVVKSCPYCQGSFSATDMRKHQPGCARNHKNAPPQERTMPDDLENQVLSSDPLERLRQLDQQEQDRIEEASETS